MREKIYRPRFILVFVLIIHLPLLWVCLSHYDDPSYIAKSITYVLTLILSYYGIYFTQATSIDDSGIKFTIFYKTKWDDIEEIEILKNNNFFKLRRKNKTFAGTGRKDVQRYDDLISKVLDIATKKNIKVNYL